MNPKVYAVILAGGSGTRLWPISRSNSGKQIRKIGPLQESLLEKALNRISDYIPIENRIVITTQEQYQGIVKKISHQCAKIIAEPQMRGTASALCLAAMYIAELNKNHDVNPVMISLHSDHLISDVGSFVECLKQAVGVCTDLQRLTLLGIVPTEPTSRFGYVKVGKKSSKNSHAFAVSEFVEKPNTELAQSYIAQGDYLWNSGIFIWPVSIILKEMASYIPKTFDLLTQFFRDSLNSDLNLSSQQLLPVYDMLPTVTIDEGVLEKSKNLALVKASFDWDDVGSWNALSKIIPADQHKNLKFGPNITHECINSVIYSEKPLIAAIGLSDIIVVATEDAILVCAKNQAEKVKIVVDKIKNNEQFSNFL